MLPPELDRVSSSEEFQLFLDRNPPFQRQAGRDRRGIALRFGPARGLGPFYADAVMHGVHPERLFVPYEPPVRDPPPKPAPVPLQSHLNASTYFLIGAAQDPLVDLDFHPGEDNAVYTFLRTDVMGPTQGLEVTLHDLTDDCEIYLGKPGISSLDSDLSHYFRAQDLPGSTSTRLVLNGLTIAAYGGALDLVPVHTGDLPFVYGTMTVTVTP